MKKILAILLVFVPFCIFAQENPDATQAVKDFSQKMQTVKTINATFTFTLENLQEKITDTHQGKIIAKGNKYILEMMGMEIYFDGITKWQYIKEANEVTISKQTTSDGGFLDDPSKLFKDYDKNFKSKFIGEHKDKNRTIYELDFFPKDLNLPYSAVKLQFDRNSLEPVLIRYQGKDGNNYIIKVKTFKSNLPVRDDRFTFESQKHKGIEVIDMR
ncbi:MAG TPA: outer membrane lipoprotein carrier protein LolA [Tenuifilaceae bacterium]|nr:outer membrane lipoprotein carrier protein LolA [Tenuifilaceae bacterium]HPI44427.1 outer membrane lipoprotein carrier protein LolA [Tenuifilaceae bacterium]HPN21700.1 outer membrane lipoprotein carrier protein LolA [Tenuifilaceae bacterium]